MCFRVLQRYKNRVLSIICVYLLYATVLTIVEIISTESIAIKPIKRIIMMDTSSVQLTYQKRPELQTPVTPKKIEKINNQNFVEWVPFSSDVILMQSSRIMINHSKNRIILKNTRTVLTERNAYKYLKSNTITRLLSDAKCELPVGSKWVIPRFMGNCTQSYNMQDIVTLAFQMTVSEDRLQVLRENVLNWKGPISIALYFEKHEKNVSVYTEVLEDIFRTYNINGSLLCIHLVTNKDNKTMFPINTLRNIAIRYAQTDHVLLLEGDFIVPQTLEDTLKEHIPINSGQKESVALVVPAYGSNHPHFKMPESHIELLQQWKKKITLPIHYLRNFKLGHFPTHYRRILLGCKSPDYQVKYKHHYEPYYVVNRRTVPFYPEDFTFGYKDKAIHSTLLSNLGFKFLVLCEAFVVTRQKSKGFQKSVFKTEKGKKCESLMVNTIVHNMKHIANLTNTNA